MSGGARDSFGRGRCGNGGAVFGSGKARVRGFQGGVGVGDVLGRRISVHGMDHERLGVGRFGLNGDLVRVVSFVDGHPAISPPDLGDEETQEWAAEDNAEFGGYDAEGQGKAKLPECGAHSDVVGARHEPAVGGADVARRVEVSDLDA